MKEVKVSITIPTKILLDWCINDFWEHFEECWKAKSGIGEEYGILKDCGLTGNAKDYIDVKEITVTVTAFYEEIKEE